MKRVDRDKYNSWLFQAAENFYERGNFEKALKYFERLNRQHGKFLEPSMKADCYAYMGDIYLFHEDFARAIEYLNKAIDIDNRFPHYFYLLGMVYQTQENFRRAIEEFDQATKLEPKNSIYMEELGRTFVLTGNLEQGEKLLKKAWRLDKSNVGAGVELAGVLFSLGKFKETIELADEVVEMEGLHEGIIEYLNSLKEDAKKSMEERAQRRRGSSSRKRKKKAPSKDH